MVAGRFHSIGGRQKFLLARLTPDGLAEDTFRPPVGSNPTTVTSQTDGRILIGGDFQVYPSGWRTGIARLLPDGRVDQRFDLASDNYVMAIVPQADGTTLVGGFFAQLGGQPHTCIAKLNPDGTVDHTFNPSLSWTTETMAIPSVHAIATQEDGKILIAGSFDAVNGERRINFARLNPDGTLDQSFNASLRRFVYSIAVQPDGRILVAGDVSEIGGLADRRYLGRFNADGTLDAEFNPQVNNLVNFILLQADGRAVIGGWFTTVAGQSRYYLARLNDDGTLDGSFDLKLRRLIDRSSGVNCGLLQADGRLLVGGNGFSTEGGEAIRYVARIFNTGPATEEFSVDPTGTSVTWLRGGTGPEVSSVSYEVSINGKFIPLGTAARVPGGWRVSLGGLVLSPGQKLNIRARGFYATGAGGSGGSTAGSFVETVRTVEGPGGAPNQ
jgi:uncharacterized delta-60 repeat protein